MKMVINLANSNYCVDSIYIAVTIQKIFSEEIDFLTTYRFDDSAARVVVRHFLDKNQSKISHLIYDLEKYPHERYVCPYCVKVYSEMRYVYKIDNNCYYCRVCNRFYNDAAQLVSEVILYEYETKRGGNKRFFYYSVATGKYVALDNVRIIHDENMLKREYDFVNDFVFFVYRNSYCSEIDELKKIIPDEIEFSDVYPRNLIYDAYSIEKIKDYFTRYEYIILSEIMRRLYIKTSQ
jgi:ribosomal protein L37AE/L43A